MRNTIVGVFIRTLAGVSLAVAGLWVAQPAAPLTAQQSRNTAWAEYLGGPDSSHYSPLKQINRSNVAELQVAWTYESKDNGSIFSPLVVDNVAYVSAKGGALVALDATTGRELWTFTRPAPAGAPGGGGRGGGTIGQRGLNYWESADRSDRRILFSSGGSLIAVNAQTGKLIDGFGVNGYVDLQVGVHRATGPVSSRCPGRVFENLLILGSSTGEGTFSPPGDLRAFDVRTGTLVWSFHTVPHPGEIGYETSPKDGWKYLGGANAWGEITVDQQRGIAYFPLGSMTYDFYGADRKGDNLFGNSILALDARTGKYRWHFQTIHHDLWDYDLAAAPQLATITQNGRRVDVVAQASKHGFLFVLDRVTGKPIWPIEERAVPKSDVPGEHASPTQPFPTVVPPFARQSVSADDLDPFYLKGPDLERWRARVLAARNDGLFTPPTMDRETLQMPGNNGGAVFHDTAADPTRGLVYVKAKEVPALIKLVKAGEPTTEQAGFSIGIDPTAGQRAGGAGRGGRGAVPASAEAVRGRAVYEQTCQACHGPDLRGDARAPRIDDVWDRLGPDGTRAVIRQGRGLMPSFSSLPEDSINAVLAFLASPSSAPAGRGGGGGRGGATGTYPPGVEAPALQLRSGYGLEPLLIGPPWNTLTAYDLNKGTIQWQVPYGDSPEAGPSDTLRGNVISKSGPVVTAGGLIFYAGNDARLYALDQDTGKVLWSAPLPDGSQGVPAVYEVNGRQFLLVPATGGFPQRLAPGVDPPQRGAKSYVAFALPAARSR